MDTFYWGEYDLDVEQRLILQHVISGKSVFVTGAAGTGKSILLRHIIHILQIAYPEQYEVAVTAPTGIASFPLGGYTLHSWAGLEPNSVNYPVSDLVRGIRNRRHLVQHWKMVKVLIIDEISLVNMSLFEKLDGIGKAIRRNELPFGGIQVVACGDFLQLPPVAETSVEKNGSRFCFSSKVWEDLFGENIYCLQKVHRSLDPEWTQVLEELRCAKLSPESRVLLKSRVRPLNSNELRGIRLYPRRRQVDEFNALRLSELDGREFIWNGTEIGEDYDREILERCCLAPRRLMLKVGSPVLLLKNLDQKRGLINGRQGIVIGVDGVGEGEQTVPGHQYSPVVRFGEIVLTLEPAEWNYKNGHQVKATRSQFPLLLADSISTHKAQGMTLDEAVVDLRGIFEDGQAYVGLSRVRSLAGLTCLGVIPFQVIRADKYAVDYWERIRGRVPNELIFDEDLPKKLWVGWWGLWEGREAIVLKPFENVWRVWVVGTGEVICGELTTDEILNWYRKSGEKRKQTDLRIWYKTKV